MARGVIKRLAADKGYGFIRPDGWKAGDADLFFHRSGAETAFDSMREGQRVECDEVDSPKGPRASNVRVIE